MGPKHRRCLPELRKDEVFLLPFDQSVLADCIKHYEEVRRESFVVQDSMPIPFFGDLAAYSGSQWKIVTAAINPSGKEFPRSGPVRFDVSAGLNNSHALEEQLAEYFKLNPYRRWFSSFERVLNGMGASYGGKMSRSPFATTALHLDMCSPIATSPTWSKLGKEVEKLVVDGRAIFDRLVAELRPDLIIASVQWGHLQNWHQAFQEGPHWPHVMKYTTKKNGEPSKAKMLVQSHDVLIGNHECLFVNCSAGVMPLSNFSNERKAEVGMNLLDLLMRRSERTAP